MKDDPVPNLKVHVNRDAWNVHENSITNKLPVLRELVCMGLKADISACQIAVIPFGGIDGQAEVAIEVDYLPKPERTREMVSQVCMQIKTLMIDATGCRVAVRATAVNPETYIVIH